MQGGNGMFWDKASSLYDFFETVYNYKVYKGTGKKVAEFVEAGDTVLECACGTGGITVDVAPKCRRMIASDFSIGMLRKASKKCRRYGNVTFKKADITNLKCKANRFDKAIAGNVIHLLPQPQKAMEELERVVKPGGKIIIPTYINMAKQSNRFVTGIVGKMGANFQNQFDLRSYMEFFRRMGYRDVEYYVVDGRMPCAIAVIQL